MKVKLYLIIWLVMLGVFSRSVYHIVDTIQDRNLRTITTIEAIE